MFAGGAFLFSRCYNTRMETLRGIKETEVAAERALNEAVSRPSSANATVFALYGDLGSGKTAFTKAVAAALGVPEVVTSPTFVIEKVYALAHPVFDRLIHIDAYRLEHSDELRALGWNDVVSDPKNLIVVEWADRVEDLLPEDTRRFSLSVVDEMTRSLVCRP